MAISIAAQSFGKPSKAVMKEAIIESTTAYGMILADVASFPTGWASPLEAFESNVAAIEADFHSAIQARAIAVCMFAKGYHGQAINPHACSAAEVAIHDFAKAWKASGYKMDGDTMCAAGVTSECIPILFNRIGAWAKYTKAA